MSEVVGGGESGGEPIPQPSDDARGVEELSFQFNGGRGGGGRPLAGGPPVDKFSFRDQEGHAYVSAFRSNSGDQIL